MLTINSNYLNWAVLNYFCNDLNDSKLRLVYYEPWNHLFLNFFKVEIDGQLVQCLYPGISVHRGKSGGRLKVFLGINVKLVFGGSFFYLLQTLRVLPSS